MQYLNPPKGLSGGDFRTLAFESAESARGVKNSAHGKGYARMVVRARPARRFSEFLRLWAAGWRGLRFSANCSRGPRRVATRPSRGAKRRALTRKRGRRHCGEDLHAEIRDRRGFRAWRW